MIGTVRLREDPQYLAMRPDGKRLFAATHNYATDGGNVLTVVDTATLKVTATVKAGRGPWVFAVAPDGRTGYLTNRASNSVTVLALGV